MDEDLKRLLGEAIQKELQDLDDISDPKEREAAVERINKLYRLMIDEEKIELESETFYAKLDEDRAEQARKSEVEASERKYKKLAGIGSTLCNIGLKVLEVGVPAAVSVLGYRIFEDIHLEDLKFETENAWTAATTKNTLSRLFQVFCKK